MTVCPTVLCISMTLDEAFAHLQRNLPDDAQTPSAALIMGHWRFSLNAPKDSLLFRTIDKRDASREQWEVLTSEGAKGWMARIAINYQAPPHPFFGWEYQIIHLRARKHDEFGAAAAWLSSCRLGLAVVEIGESGIHFQDPHSDKSLVSYSTEPGKQGKWRKPFMGSTVLGMEISAEEAYQAMLLLNPKYSHSEDPFTETLFLPESMTSQLQEKRDRTFPGSHPADR